MGIIIRQSIISSVILYIGIVIGTVNTLFLYPSVFDVKYIGLLRLLQDLPFLLALIFAFSAPNLTEKYFFSFSDHNKKHNGFLFFILSYPLIGFLTFLGLFFAFKGILVEEFSKKSPLFVDYLYFVIPLTFIFIYTNIMESYLKVNMKVSAINFNREVSTRILLTMLALAFPLFHLSQGQGVWIFVLSYLSILLVHIGYTWQQNLLFLKPQMANFPKEKRGEMSTFVMYMIPGAIGSMVAHKIDTAMIAAYIGLDYLAVYSLAYFIAVVVEVPRKSISQISVPILSKAFNENDTEKIQELYQKNSVNQFLSGALLFSMIWICADEILNIIPQKEIFRSGKYVILFIGLGKLVDMITSLNSEIIQLSKFFRFNIMAMLFLGVLTVVTNHFLLPTMGITGAAVAYFVTVLLFNLFKTFFVYKKMGYQPFRKELLPLIGFIAIAIAFEYFFPGGNRDVWSSLILIVVKSTVVLSLFLFMVRKFYISPEFNDLLNMIAAKAGLTRLFNNGAANK